MLVVHVDSERTWRGGQQQVSYLVQGMLDEGETPIVAGRTGSELLARMSKRGVETLGLSYAAGGLAGALKLNKFCRERNVDIVHVHSSRAHSLAYIASLLGSFPPIVVSKRTDFPIKKSGLSFKKYKTFKIKKILCVSAKIAQIAKETLGEDSRVVPVHSGIDPGRFDVEKKDLRAELGLPSDSILIGNTSAIADQKDYFTFLKVAKKLSGARESLKFVIFGDGPMGDEIKAYAKKIGVDDKVIFTGFRNDLPSVLPNLDIFLMTSKTEGLGTSLLDAMVCKVPIVSTRAGGIPEIVRHMETGLTTEVGDVEGLTRLTCEYLEKPELRKELADNAYAMATGEFHRTSTSKKTIEIYREILG